MQYDQEHAEAALLGIWDMPLLRGVRKKKVEVRLKMGQKTVVLTGVPQAACAQCGSRVYKSMTLRVLEALMRSE